MSLSRRYSTNSAWRPVATTTTSSTGTASLRLKPNRYLQLQWRYAGNAQYRATHSSIHPTTVAQVVTIATTRSSVPHGSPVKIYGYTNPASGGQKVYLQRKAGTNWKTLTSTTLAKQRLPNGSTRIGYVFTRRIATIGQYTFRVLKPNTTTLAAGLSKAIAIKIT